MFLIHINANASNGHDDGICSVSGFSFAENFLNFYSAPELCVGHKMTFFNHKIVLYVANQSQRKSMLPNQIKIPSLVPLGLIPLHELQAQTPGNLMKKKSWVLLFLEFDR